jgi:uncharacterized protein with NRDE domain
MCLILLAYGVHPAYRLIVAANRDEFYDRPTRPLGFWDDLPGILAGRDLKAGGTWLGMTRTGRLAAVTNFRETTPPPERARSRGLLVREFLSGCLSPQPYLEQVQAAGGVYRGFNLLVGDPSGIYYHSNRDKGIQKLRPGIYGLSNHLLDTPWPKVQQGKSLLEGLVQRKAGLAGGDVFNILHRRRRPPDALLPETGVGRAWERVLSSMFIVSPAYGTRSSSAILAGVDGKVSFAERTYTPRPAGRFSRRTRTVVFTPRPDS